MIARQSFLTRLFNPAPTPTLATPTTRATADDIVALAPHSLHPLAIAFIAAELTPPMVDGIASPFLRDRMLAEHQAYLTRLANNPDATRQWMHELDDLMATLPEPPDPIPHPFLTFDMPTIAHHPDPAGLVTDILRSFLARSDPIYPGHRGAAFLRANMLEISQIDEDTASRNPRRVIWPTQLDADPATLANLYFSETPLADTLTEHAPLTVSHDLRHEHMAVFAGTGHGKSESILDFFVRSIERPNPGAHVLIDSHGGLIKEISRLPHFDPDNPHSLADRLLIVDTTDVEWTPSINMFDMSTSQLDSLSPRNREKVLTEVIDGVSFILSKLITETGTSHNMDAVLRFLAQFMLVIPDATIFTLRDLLRDPAPYMDHVARLDPVAQDFFLNEFFGERNIFKQSRDALRRRLMAVLAMPGFARLFGQPRNKLDLFTTLNNGGIVLIRNDLDFLQEETSAIVGRFFIAMTYKAALERLEIDEHDRMPTTLWLDEAAPYFDDNIENFLVNARKMKLGLCFATQYVKRLPDQLRTSVMTNTTIKLAGGGSWDDCMLLAHDMDTTPEYLRAIKKDNQDTPRFTRFAASVKNVTASAMTLTVPIALNNIVRRYTPLSDEQYQRLIDASRKRLVPTKHAPDDRQYLRTVPATPTNDFSDDPWYNPHNPGAH